MSPPKRVPLRHAIPAVLAVALQCLAWFTLCPSQALADGATWRYLGMQAMRGDAGEPNDAAYPYGGGDIQADVNASDSSVHTVVRATNDGNLAFSYVTDLRWSVPGSIEVGREQDVRIDGDMSIGDFQIGKDPLGHDFLPEEHEPPKVDTTFSFQLYKAVTTGGGERSELETYGGGTDGPEGFQMGFEERPRVRNLLLGTDRHGGRGQD